MKSVRLNYSIIVLGFMTLFGSCKVKSQKAADGNSMPENESTSVTDLAVKTAEKVNPNEALVKVVIGSMTEEADYVVITGELSSIEQRGFGFKSNINSGDTLIINVGKDISLTGTKEVKCIIRESIRFNKTTPEYQLIKLVK